MKPFLPLLLLFAACSSASPTVVEPTVVEGRRFDMELQWFPANPNPGEEVTLEIHVSMDFGYHLYGAKDKGGYPTTLQIQEAGGLLAVGNPVVPDGNPQKMGDKLSYWLEDQFVIQQKFLVPEEGAKNILIRGNLDFMACTIYLCDPPGQERFELAPPHSEAEGL